MTSFPPAAALRLALYIGLNKWRDSNQGGYIGGWNVGSVLTIAQKIAEVREMAHTRNLLTWAICRAVGAGFTGMPPEMLRAAKKELASEARITTRSIEQHMAVYAVTRDMPEDMLGLVQFSTARSLVELFGAEQAQRMIEEVHDSDLSLVQARVQALKDRIKDEKARRKTPALKDVLQQFLGDYWTAMELNETERTQVRELIDEVLTEFGTTDLGG